MAKDRGAALAILGRQVDVMSRAEDLAARGASFAARAEMIKALRLITQVLDAQDGGARILAHWGSHASVPRSGGLPAPRLAIGGRIECEPDCERTSDARTQTGAGRAPGAGYRTAAVFGSCPTAIGRRQRRTPRGVTSPPRVGQDLHGPRPGQAGNAGSLSAASGRVAPGGVAGRPGQLPGRQRTRCAARPVRSVGRRPAVLLHGIAVHGAPEMWRNLSVVHERLGEPDLARRARREADLVASSRETRRDQDWAETVRWVDATTFTAAGAAAGH